ncbi:MAG: ATPase, T2SS/T4P/T4SS family [Bdellovibrionota bacterium]
MATGLEEVIRKARELKASDIHIESGSPVFLRIQGQLRTAGEAIAHDRLKGWITDLLGPRETALKSEQSIDISETLGGVRTRIHIFYSSRGLSIALRLLTQQQPTLESLNLHPNLHKLLGFRHGLVLVCGPTGSGKSSTIAALVHEMNVLYALNMVTLEKPIEYFHRNQRSFIRQREVGRDTPSFEKGLVDAMREDPDVIVVGEMQDTETMRLTLNAAETGHLVFATLHASSVAEALSRILKAFPAEGRDNIAAQLGQVLQAVVCQQLSFQPKFNQRLPVCELFFSTTGARAKIRNQDLSSLPDTYYAGAEAGCMHMDRYRQWVDGLTSIHKPKADAAPLEKTVPNESASVVAERYQAKAQIRKEKGDVYSIDETDDDLWTAIKKLEK